MKKIIAVPADKGAVCVHFGHCPYFAVYVVENEKIVEENKLEAPPHQPGLLPAWLKEKQVTDIIACGMGQRAIDLFNQNDINVIVGVEPNKQISTLVKEYLEGKLSGGGNFCDH